MSRVSEPCVSLDEVIAAMYETGKDMSAKYRETYHGCLGKIQPKIGEGGMKYNTMNNDEIILSLCARIRETRISLALTQQQLADRAQVGIATIKRIERRRPQSGHTYLPVACTE